MPATRCERLVQAGQRARARRRARPCSRAVRGARRRAARSSCRRPGATGAPRAPAATSVGVDLGPLSPTMRLYNTLTRSEEPFAPGAGNTVRMYTCGLTVYARGHIGNFRTFVCLDVLRRTLKYLLGLRREAGDELHRRGRSDDRRRAEGRHGPAQLHRPVHRRVPRGLARARARGRRGDAARDGRGQPAARWPTSSPRSTQNGHTYRQRRVDLLQDLDAARLRQAGAPRSRGHEARRARRRRQLRQRRRPRFRAVEGDQAGRADVGRRRSARPPGLAPRVLGDGAAPARRVADRHPRRRHRSDLPAPRERDRAERRRDRQAVLALLGPRRVPARRRAEDVEVARQHVHDSRRRRARVTGRRRCATCCCRRTTASS